MSTSIRINQEIRAKELRVIDIDGTQLGILSRDEALRAAEQAGVDLIEISPNADPPVAKIIDWGKYQYQKMKEQQKSKKNAKTIDLKQMRLGLKIGSNDLAIKLRKVREFLDEGHKVRIVIMFRGREIAHTELGYEMMQKIIALLGEDTLNIEQAPQIAGRNLSMVIRSK